jgi:type IV secretory pathway TrbF-like protein
MGADDVDRFGRLKAFFENPELTQDEAMIYAQYDLAEGEYLRRKKAWESTHFYKQRARLARILMMIAMLIVAAGMVGIIWIGAQILVGLIA